MDSDNKKQRRTLKQNLSATCPQAQPHSFTADSSTPALQAAQENRGL